MIKDKFFLIILSLSVFAFAGCKKTFTSIIKNDISVINDGLPRKVAYMTIHSFELKDKTIEIKLTHDCFDYICDNQDYLRRWALASFLPNVIFKSNDEWLAAVQQDGFDFNLIFCSPSNSERVTLKLEANEILNMLEILESPYVKNHIYLQLDAELINSLPKIDQGDARLKQIIFEDSIYTYEYYLKNNDYEMYRSDEQETFRCQLAQALDSGYRSTQDESILLFLNRLYENDVVLKYVYYLEVEDSLSIIFTPDQLKSILTENPPKSISIQSR